MNITQSQYTREGVVDVRTAEMPDEQLTSDAEEEVPEATVSNGLDWQRLTTILRRVGGLVLVASALAFLLQQWVGMDSLRRYYSFLGFTVLLTAAGMFCGVVLKEDKGARTFLSIAALFLPAHFTQLGALVYSLFLDNHKLLFLGQNEYIRNLAIYKAPNALAAWGTVVGASLVLGPICYAGFSGMARAEAKKLTAAYFLSSALLLVPTRDPNVIASLVLAGFAALAYLDAVVFSKQSAMQTTEAVAVRLMMFAPLGVLLGRNFLLYNPTTAIYAVVFAIVATILFEGIPQLFESDKAKELFQAFSLVPAAFSWACFAEASFFEHGALLEISRDYTLIAYALPIGAIFSAMSLRAVGGGRYMRKIAACIAVFSVLIQLIVVGGLISSFVCVAAAIVVIIAGFVMEEKGLFNLGSLGLACGLLYHLRYAADIFTVSPWLSLAVLGSLTVLSASYLEANHRVVVERVAKFRTRLAAWN